MKELKEQSKARYKSVDVIIPTYQPGEKLHRILLMLSKQSYPVHKIIIIDSLDSLNKPDYNVKNNLWIKPFGDSVELHCIPKASFDHAATRNMGVSFSNSDYFLMMTDDSIPQNALLIERLVKALESHPMAGTAYARQLPGKESSFDEKLSRLFNYPKKSRIKGIEDVAALGIKTFFQSNVCCMYRRDLFDKLGGFSSPAIFNEDMVYCHNMLRSGYLSVYVANAKVLHSHNYGSIKQLRRNFDLGVSQADHPEVFGGISSEGEGIRMIRIGCSILSHRRLFKSLPTFLLRSGCKWIGYRLGKSYRKVPKKLVMKLSMNKSYWKQLQ